MINEGHSKWNIQNNKDDIKDYIGENINIYFLNMEYDKLFVIQFHLLIQETKIQRLFSSIHQSRSKSVR
jgi:hypothetical protein